MSPHTSVVNPKEVLESLKEEVSELNVDIRLNCHINTIDSLNRTVYLSDGLHINYSHLVNCAGINADFIAKYFNVGGDYSAMPFKGLYWNIRSSSRFSTMRNVYPVPDLDVPFLAFISLPTQVEVVFL